MEPWYHNGVSMGVHFVSPCGLHLVFQASLKQNLLGGIAIIEYDCGAFEHLVLNFTSLVHRSIHNLLQSAFPADNSP